MALFDFFKRRPSPNPTPSPHPGPARTPISLPHFTVTLPGRWQRQPTADAISYTSTLTQEQLIIGFEPVTIPPDRRREAVTVQLQSFLTAMAQSAPAPVMPSAIEVLPSTNPAEGRASAKSPTANLQAEFYARVTDTGVLRLSLYRHNNSDIPIPLSDLALAIISKHTYTP
jgi:hypothetical protein